MIEGMAVLAYRSWVGARALSRGPAATSDVAVTDQEAGVFTMP